MLDPTSAYLHTKQNEQTPTMPGTLMELQEPVTINNILYKIIADKENESREHPGNLHDPEIIS